MEAGMTILLYTDLVLVGLFTVLLVIISTYEVLQKKEQRDEEAEEVKGKAKEIKDRKVFTGASPQPSGAQA